MSVKLDNNLVSEIRRLRIDESLSIKSIQSRLNIGRGTVSLYCKGLSPSNPSMKLEAIRRNALCGSVRNQIKCEQNREDIKNEAIRRWPEVRQSPEAMAMLALYWAEGKKRHKGKSGSLVFINSDPGAVYAFITYLSKLIPSVQYVATVRVYPEQDANVCVDAWSKAINIQCRIEILKRRNPSTRIYSKNGVCSIYARGNAVWIIIMAWIDLWRQELGVIDNWQL